MFRKDVFQLLILIFIFSPLRSFAETVTFIVKPLTFPDTGRVFISGNHPQIGNWQADKISLDKQEGGTWKKSFIFDRGTRLEYKFTRGSWDKEALAAKNIIPGNRKLKITGDTLINIVIPKWKDEVKDAHKEIHGQVTGRLIIHKDMQGTGIVPRDVLVWLPPGYKTDTDKYYPVLYMHDGQQIFNPRTSTHGIDWQIDETVTDLINQGRMQDIIVVGNNSTINRGEEYADGPEGSAYRNFMVNILKPFIDEKYRTKPERKYTSVMGSSMGGLASFLLLWYHPDIYSMAGCLSPSFWLDWNKLETSKWQEFPVKIYIDNGGVGLDEELQPGVDRMLKVLKKKNFKQGENLIYHRDPKAEHNEEAWSKRAWMPLLYKYGIGKQDWIGNRCRSLTY